MLDLVGKRHWYFLISGLVLILGVASLVAWGLRLGIDFTGGTMITISFNQEVEQEELREELETLGHGDAIIQGTEEGGFLIRTRTLGEGEQQTIIDALSRFGIEESSIDAVSAAVAEEKVRYAIYAVAAASVAILLYVTWAFRKVPKPFRYGSCAIGALLHDVLVVLGIFAVLGELFNTEINAIFIIGLLTVIGYSVHDTIVVFDRIRENSQKSPLTDFETTVNNSILETLGRSLNTSLTLIFVLLALFLFGGVTIQNFILALLIGIISGTYSSICIASQLLVVWENNDIGRLFRRIRPRRAIAAEE